MSKQHTVNGLLRKRADMMAELAGLRERMAVVSNDVASLERVLEAFGYSGPLDTPTPRGNRVVLFYRNELRHFLLSELGKAAGVQFTAKSIRAAR